MSRSPSPRFRGVAVAALLAVLATGSGLPMCASLLAQALAPCAMHTAGGHHDHHGTPPAGGAELTALPDGPLACHTTDAALGCASGTTCPTAGAAAPAWGTLAVSNGAPAAAAMASPAAALRSFIAPPLAPPPQA